MANLQLFQPYTAISLDTSAVSDNVQLPSPGSIVRLFNNSQYVVYVKFGPDDTVTATDDDLGIPPGGVESFSIAPNKFAQVGMPETMTQPYIAAISPDGAGRLSITVGQGA